MAAVDLIDFLAEPHTPRYDFAAFRTMSMAFDMAHTWPRAEYVGPHILHDVFVPAPAGIGRPPNFITRDISPMDTPIPADEEVPAHSPMLLTPSPDVSASKPSHSKNLKRKHSPGSCTAFSVTTANAIVSDRLASATTPVSPPKSPFSPIMTTADFDKEVDDFWLGPSAKPKFTSPDKAHPRSPKNHRKPPSLPIVLGIKDKSSDTASDDEYSVLSDDVLPPSTASQLKRFTVQEENEFFDGVFETIDRAFNRFEEKFGHDIEELMNLARDDKYIDLPEVYEKDVFMGQRPDGTGLWNGIIAFNGMTQLQRLFAPGKVVLLGFEFGYIEDFRCRGGAALLFGSDRRVYYYDADGDVVDEEDGEGYTYLVHGPLDLKQFGTSHVLDPKSKSKY
jgi:hypothetical protein